MQCRQFCLFSACVLTLACLSAAQEPQQGAGARLEEAPITLQDAAFLDPKAFAAARGRIIALARASFLDKTGRTPLPLPSVDFPKTVSGTFSKETDELRSLCAQIAYLQMGRGSEDLPAYADMVLLVAMRLGIEPAESALPAYRSRLRPQNQTMTPQQSQGFSELTAQLHQTSFKRRYVYIADLLGKTTVMKDAVAEPSARKGQPRGAKPRRSQVSPPPEPQGPPESVLEAIDWGRADELAAAAAAGADGWNRRTSRRRRGRCYEWVRMALQKTGLWTDAYRSEVSSRGDWRRPRRAYSFAWAMNAIESRKQKDPFAGREAPLRRLDLRVDPLVKGSIVVFDRNACGYNAKSGHIEVITSIEPLRASSYKFHDVKLDCLIKAADDEKVHVYVPQRLDPHPPISPNDIVQAAPVPQAQAAAAQTATP